jgi:hypothetical protein
MLSFHQFHRFLRDPATKLRARHAFDRLVAAARDSAAASPARSR